VNEHRDRPGRVQKTPPIESALGRERPVRPAAELEPHGDVPKAAAIQYRRGQQGAPVVTAFGKGELAQQIIAVARTHGVYIQPDPDLVELLAQVDVGMAIPPQLYYVVAEILAFVYKLNGVQAAIGLDHPASTNSAGAHR
jgi:flagellar biosynthesis protein